MLDLLGTLDAEEVIDLVYETLPAPGQPTRLVLQITKDGHQRPETAELLGLLRLTPGRIHYPLVLPTIEHETAGPGSRSRSSPVRSSGSSTSCRTRSRSRSKMKTADA